MNAVTKTISALAFASVATAQNVLYDHDVPFIGGNVFKSNEPAVANYTLSYKPPFDPKTYGGYYYWSVNNNTVIGTNFTGYDTKDGYFIPDGLTGKYPYFQVSEGHPKQINKSKLFEACGGSKFKKILHIVFENEVYDWTMGQPYWKMLATRGKLLTRSYAITHPSLPNYAAIVAGDYFGMAHEDFYNVNVSSIYDLLDASNISYGTYVEWYNSIATHRGPNDCNNYITNGPMDSTNPEWASQSYRRLDVPALLFSTYTGNYERCSKIYGANNTFADHVMSHTLPEYSYYVPDMLHNAHDPESNSDYFNQPNTGGQWLSAFLDLYLPELEAQGTLVVVTFDEATWENDAGSSPNNENHIATILFGSGIIPNTTDDTYITLYGILRGAIQNFGLGSLGRNDTNATNGNLFDLVGFSRANMGGKDHDDHPGNSDKHEGH
ncbi:hypothetical protein N7539_001133 [Penicillium diatomitis]|uniref:Acid phosphatase n=1 Tax=Penicillium diatomitis TaxID=2819901 RepID=A0A9W9XN39_9EURO|nr:uncharacterized protein N7539_001133 [Penicillium diatomitis]KAJ5496017.1 hypothetical protein N7539_001133 [Penicillium diatomitis]